MTVWRAMDGIHQQVITGESREEEDFALGYMVLLDDDTSWDVYLSPHPKANMKFAKKNDTFQGIVKTTGKYALSKEI